MIAPHQGLLASAPALLKVRVWRGVPSFCRVACTSVSKSFSRCMVSAAFAGGMPCLALPLAVRRKKSRAGRPRQPAALIGKRVVSLASPPFPQRLEGILFDIDGTLADTDPLHFCVFADVLMEAGFNEGVPISRDFFLDRITGRQNREICRDLFPSWDNQQGVQFADHKEAVFRERAGTHLVPMPGLDELMTWCTAEGLKKAAVTNAPRLNAECILDGIKRSAWFDELIIGDECERGKPDPCPYLTAMSRLGVKADACIAFEDSPSGAQSAVAAGIFTVGILSGQSASKLRDAGCGILIGSYDDECLWRLLKEAELVSA